MNAVLFSIYKFIIEIIHLDRGDFAEKYSSIRVKVHETRHIKTTNMFPHQQVPILRSNNIVKYNLLMNILRGWCDVNQLLY